MPVLGRSAFSGLKLKTKQVPVPELGDDNVALLRELTGAERDAYEAGLINSRVNKRSDMQDLNMTNARARLVIVALIGEDGTQLFDPTSAADLALIGAWPGSVLDRLYDEAAKLSGLTEEDKAALMGKSKPSPPTNGEGSGTV